MATITEHEERQVKRANASGRRPVVFIHGLWLLPNSWDRWRPVFQEGGYTTLAPGWPDDPNTYAVPGSGVPLFQAATANLNPWTEAKANSKNPDRGPLLITSGCAEGRDQRANVTIWPRR